MVPGAVLTKSKAQALPYRVCSLNIGLATAGGYRQTRQHKEAVL